MKIDENCSQERARRSVRYGVFSFAIFQHALPLLACLSLLITVVPVCRAVLLLIRLFFHLSVCLTFYVFLSVCMADLFCLVENYFCLTKKDPITKSLHGRKEAEADGGRGVESSKGAEHAHRY